MDELADCVSLPLFASPDVACSNRSLLVYYLVQYWSVLYKGDYQKAFDNSIKAIQLFCTYSFLRDDFAQVYSALLYQRGRLALIMGDKEEAYNLLNDFDRYPGLSPLDRVYQKLLALRIGEITPSQIDELVSQINQPLNFFLKGFRSAIWYELAHYYFFSGEFKEAAYWGRKTLNLPFSKGKVDGKTSGINFLLSKILIAFSYFELGECELCDYHLRSVYRFAISNGYYTSYLRFQIRLLSKSINLFQDDLATYCLAQLTEMELLSYTAGCRCIKAHFNIELWLRKKITKT